ncbi:MAG: response regulator [Zetaproteobacteria bacterium]|nr:response regulator [Zetaproteobacteria bacterium]
MKIMCVDDQNDFLLYNTHLLTERGHQVQAFDKPMEAMRALETFDPDVIISDINMPGVHGLGVLQYATLACPKAHQVILSANTREETIQDKGEIPERCVYFKKPIKKDFFDFVDQLPPVDRGRERRSSKPRRKLDVDYLSNLAALYKTLDGLLLEIARNSKEFSGDEYWDQRDKLQNQFGAALSVLAGNNSEAAENIVTGLKKEYGFWGDTLLQKPEDIVPAYQYTDKDGFLVNLRNFHSWKIETQEGLFDEGDLHVIRSIDISFAQQRPKMLVNGVEVLSQTQLPKYWASADGEHLLQIHLHYSRMMHFRKLMEREYALNYLYGSSYLVQTIFEELKVSFAEPLQVQLPDHEEVFEAVRLEFVDQEMRKVRAFVNAQGERRLLSLPYELTTADLLQWIPPVSQWESRYKKIQVCFDREHIRYQAFENGVEIEIPRIRSHYETSELHYSEHIARPEYLALDDIAHLNKYVCQNDVVAKPLANGSKPPAMTAKSSLYGRFVKILGRRDRS